MQLLSSMRLAAIAGAVLLASCGGNDDPAPPAPEETRAQDSRTFTATAATTFTAMAPLPGATQTDIDTLNNTSRWAGVLDGAAYRVEVPANWNGKLVMYAHGYAGTGAALGVSNPSLRRYFITHGYAWAASSYSKNYYDVRAGVEDTNALALAFTSIASANSRPLTAPTKIFITGHSMGGHITAAAIEDEAYATAVHKVRYNGAVPMCGVVGDTELFNEFAAMQVTAQALAGVPAYPTDKWIDIQALVTNALFTTFNTTPAFPTPSIVARAGAGTQYVSVLQNITGGPRPMFAQGLAYGQSFPSAYGTFVADPTTPVGSVSGILNKNVLDTTGFTYTIDGDPDASATLNASVQKITPAADANRLRTDGLRWIPKVNGEFKIPVVSIHTLGDLFVPFSMEQVYAQRVAAKGNSQYLVQRAIRGISHCDFTVAEQEAAFDDMIAWEAGGAKPAGDDVLTPATVAAPTYGCTFTNNTVGTDDSASTVGLRQIIAASTPACP
ncbi:MAG: alpha/beta hydrolase [Rhizobacter sp.]|nr:alpha/beta hydrolase [Rhizobacter sp.]